MGFTNAARAVMLDQLGTVAVFVSLHTADPSTSGANEVTGGAPVYARKAVTWAATSGFSKVSSNSPVFDVPGATTVAFYGTWSLASGGTFYGGGALSNNETFTGQGTYTLTTATLTVT